MNNHKGFRLVFADWHSRPGRDEEWLAERRENFPEETLFRREYPETLEDVLLASEDMVFPQWAIEQCLNPSYIFPAEPYLGNPRHRYLHMWDQGRKNDAAVGVVLDITIAPYVLVAYKRFVRLPYPKLQSEIETLAIRYPGEVYVGDDNTALSIVENLNVPASHLQSTLPLKQKAIGALKLCLEKRYLDLYPIPQIVFELSSYMWDDDGIVQDSVMALAFACLKAGPPIWTTGEIGTRSVPSRLPGPSIAGGGSRAAVLAASTSSRRGAKYRGQLADHYINARDR